MNESLSQPKSTTDKIVWPRPDRDPDLALEFKERAFAVRQARRDGDEASASVLLDQLKDDLLSRARELNWTNKVLADRLITYVTLAQSDTEEVSTPVNLDTITISSVPHEKTEVSHIPLYPEGLRPTSEIDELPESPEPEAIDLASDQTTSSEQEKVRTLEEVSRELAEKRSEFAQLTAGRQRQFVDTLHETYREKQAEYNALIQEHGRLKLHDELEALTERDDKYAVTVSYLLDEQNLLRDEMNSEKNMTRRMKVINKIANFIHSGPRWKRIVKGVGIGVAAGLLGGAVGGGIAAAGVVASTRYAKSYTKNRSTGVSRISMDSARNLLTPFGGIGDDADAEGDMFTTASQRVNDRLQSDIRAEQKKKRRATYIALGTVAAGSAIGSAIHYGMDIWGGDDVASATGSVESGGDTNPGTSGFNPDGSPVSSETPFESPDGDGQTDSPDTTPAPTEEITQDATPEETVTGDGTESPQAQETTPEDVASPEDTGSSVADEPASESIAPTPTTELVNGIDISGIPPEAYEIEKGEGIFATFNEMGVPKEQWDKLLEKVGPDLVKRGLAYEDSEIGGFGWNKAGMLSKDVIASILAKAA